MLRRLFGKKPSDPAPSAGHDMATAPGVTTLDMSEVSKLAIQLAKVRQMPTDSYEMIARRVIYLERRGIGGLAIWAHEVANNLHETIEERADMVRPATDLEGGQCPFIFGTRLNEHWDAMSSADYDNAMGFTAPSNPLLMLPKFAEMLRPSGRLIAVRWWIGGEVAAQTAMDGYRLGLFGPKEAFFNAERLSVSAFPEHSMPIPPIETGHQESTSYGSDIITLIHETIAKVPQ